MAARSGSSGIELVALTAMIGIKLLHVLEKFAETMREHGGYVILCGLKAELMQIIRRYGLLDLIGRDNVFESRGEVFESAKRALARARELTTGSIDTRPLEAEIEEEPITYEIKSRSSAVLGRTLSPPSLHRSRRNSPS